jgi:hypothetical protein
MDNRGVGLRNNALTYHRLNRPGTKAQRSHAIQARYHKPGAAECLSSDMRPTYCVAKRKRRGGPWVGRFKRIERLCVSGSLAGLPVPYG